MSTKTLLDVPLDLSKKQVRTSKISVFVFLAGQLRHSRQWQGYQQAGAIEAPFTKTHQKIEHQNHVGCVSRFIKKADQDTEKKSFL